MIIIIVVIIISVIKNTEVNRYHVRSGSVTEIFLVSDDVSAVYDGYIFTGKQTIRVWKSVKQVDFVIISTIAVLTIQVDIDKC